MAKVPTANVTLDFVIPDEVDVQYISIPQSLSLMNRKSFRDGYVYGVDYLEFIGRAGDTITVAKVPEGYTTTQSWKMGFEAWKEQRHSALEETPQASPGKWADFKCLMDVGDNASTRLRPVGLSAAGTAYSLASNTGSNWETSSLFYNNLAVATTTEIFVGMLGAVTASYGGLIQTWGNTRAGTVAPDPNMPGAASDSWIIRTGEESGEMAQDVVNELEGDNDFPPYANVTDPADTPIYVGGELSCPGGVLVDTTVLGTTGRPNSMSGGLIPLGLLRLNPVWTDASAGQARILRVHLTRGKYKGVAALPMGDFK